MKDKPRKGCAREAGFTVLEVLIAMAILGVMGVGANAVLGQTFQQNGKTTNEMQVIEQVENAGYWINLDALMTQTITPSTGSGFPLALVWQDTDGHTSQVTYALSGGALHRNLTETSLGGTVLKSQQSLIASNIDSSVNMTYCSYTGGILNFQITSTIGTRSQTRNFQTKLRVDQPAYCAPALLIKTISLVAAKSGQSYNQIITAEGGTPPYTDWDLLSGSLPYWLGWTVNSNDEVVLSNISSVPTDWAYNSFTFQVTDSTGVTDVQEFSITTNPLTITTPTDLPNGIRNQAYSNQLVAVGGAGSLSWSLNSDILQPPSWLTITTNGLLGGTPSTSNLYTFYAQVKDANNRIDTREFRILVTNH